MSAFRTTRTIAHFAKAFHLAGSGEDMPAGDYRVEHEWQTIEGGSQIGYRKTSSVIYVPSISSASSVSQMVSISARELEGAVETEQP